jgi:hypothetical protein
MIYLVIAVLAVVAMVLTFLRTYTSKKKKLMNLLRFQMIKL